MQLRSKYVKIVCFVLMAVVPLLQPLYVSADTITTANIIGTNVYTEPISNEYIAGTNNNAVNNTALVHVEIILDKAYLGWVNMGTQVKYKNYYYAANPAYWGDTSKTISGNYYVNGSTINIDVPISWNSQQLGYQMGNPGNLPQSSSDVVVSITNQSNVTPIGDLSTLQDILEVLQDIKQNVEIDILDELQNIVIDLGLANQYLETISKVKRFNIPIESLNCNAIWWNQNAINNGDLDILDGFENYFKEYPIYKLNNHQATFHNIYYGYVTPDDPLSIIIISPQLNSSGWSNYLNITGSTIENINTYVVKSSFNAPYPDDETSTNHAWYIRRWDITTSNRGVVTAVFKKSPIYFIPIFVGTLTNQQYVSTDFALNWNLTNKLLSDLNIVAQGTTQSNQSASSESAVNQQFASDSQQLMDFEDTMSNNMDTQLQQINTSFDVGNTFGSKFLTSAEWVRNQFNTITNNTPFGTFISFSLLIGLSLLLVGKFL